MPRVMGVGEILQEWTAWRTECVKRRVFYILSRKKEKLHLLLGLKRILLDIDKAIAIIRETEEEAEVIPQPDDRLRQRRKAGRIRRRDQAAQHQ